MSQLFSCDLCGSPHAFEDGKHVEFSCHCLFCVDCVISRHTKVKLRHQACCCWGSGDMIDNLHEVLDAKALDTEALTIQAYLCAKSLHKNCFYEWGRVSDDHKVYKLGNKGFFGPFDTPHVTLASLIYDKCAKTGVGVFSAKADAKFSSKKKKKKTEQ